MVLIDDPFPCNPRYQTISHPSRQAAAKGLQTGLKPKKAKAKAKPKAKASEGDQASWRAKGFKGLWALFFEQQSGVKPTVAIWIGR